MQQSNQEVLSGVEDQHWSPNWWTSR